MYGIIDFTTIDTTPGARGAFAPPQGFSGDYIKFLRKRYIEDPGVRQHVFVVARRVSAMQAGFVSFRGPYAKQALGICERILKAGKKK